MVMIQHWSVTGCIKIGGEALQGDEEVLNDDGKASKGNEGNGKASKGNEGNAEPLDGDGKALKTIGRR